MESLIVDVLQDLGVRGLSEEKLVNDSSYGVNIAKFCDLTLFLVEILVVEILDLMLSLVDSTVSLVDDILKLISDLGLLGWDVVSVPGPVVKKRDVVFTLNPKIDIS